MAEFLGKDLTRSNSDASSLTAENSAVILQQSPDNHTAWTNEKHNSYLDHLEVSFVKQLQQSMGLLASVSKQNRSGKRVSQELPTGGGIVSRGLTLFSHQLPANNPYTECTGQNFMDEGDQHNSSYKSQAKRLKAAFADDSRDDQIVPSGKCHVAADNPAIDVGEPGHLECISENF